MRGGGGGLRGWGCSNGVWKECGIWGVGGGGEGGCSKGVWAGRTTSLYLNDNMMLCVNNQPHHTNQQQMLVRWRALRPVSHTLVELQQQCAQIIHTTFPECSDVLRSFFSSVSLRFINQCCKIYLNKNTPFKIP